MSVIQKNKALIALMIPHFVSGLNYGAVSVSLPEIQTEYQVTADLLAWVIAINALPHIALMPVFGRLGDQVDKRKIYLIGMAIFFSGTFLVGLSPSYFWLLMGFFIQGVGIASLALGIAVIAQIFPWQQRGVALTAWQLTIPIGDMLGAFLGGFVISQFGWQINFFALSFCSFFAIFLIWHLLPKLEYESTRSSLDWIGAISLTAFVATFLLSVTIGSRIQISTAWNISFWALSVIFLTVLVTNPFKVPEPFFNREFLTNMRFVLPSAAANLRNIGLSGLVFLLPLYLARVFNLAPQYIGIALLIHSLTLAIGTALGGYLADRLPARIPGFTGLILQAIGLAWLGFTDPGEGIFLLIPGILFFDLGAGTSLISFMKQAQSSMGPERYGVASGLFSTIRLLGSAAAAPVIGLMLEHQIEISGGISTSAIPYQYVIRILVLVVMVGAILAVFIPAKKSKVARTHS
jgi:MFS family permease